MAAYRSYPRTTSVLRRFGPTIFTEEVEVQGRRRGEVEVHWRRRGEVEVQGRRRGEVEVQGRRKEEVEVQGRRREEVEVQGGRRGEVEVLLKLKVSVLTSFVVIPYHTHSLFLSSGHYFFCMLMQDHKIHYPFSHRP